MTNEQAIKHLTAKLECLTRSKGFREKCDSYNSYEGCYECDLGYKQGNIGEQIESLKIAIKALEQEPCEDAISRKALFDMCKKEIDHISKNWQNYHSPSEAKSGFAYIATNIYDLPSVTPQPKTGHWIKEEKEFIVPSRFHPVQEIVSTCSICNAHYIGTHEDFNYCPNCGCRIIGGSGG